MLSSGTSYYYHQDGLGSVTAITDSTGNLVESYRYDVYGTPTILAPDSRLLTSSAIGNRLLFTGRDRDPDTGWYNYRHRYYNPLLGRFVQPDPIGIKGGSVNIYQYVSNSPLYWLDPYGLYGADVHFWGTYQWSLQAGVDRNTAIRIATANMGMDQGPTGPFRPAQFLRTTNPHFSQYGSHHLRSTICKLAQWAARGGNAELFGGYLHMLQDTYAHEGYSPFPGHAFSGTGPDQYSERSRRDQEMRTQTTTLLDYWIQQNPR